MLGVVHRYIRPTTALVFRSRRVEIVAWKFGVWVLGAVRKSAWCWVYNSAATVVRHGRQLRVMIGR